MRIAAVIPAHNEAASLPMVLTELERFAPEIDPLVVDDGSHDGTQEIAAQHHARFLRLKEQLGLGNAVRAGMRYAHMLGYDVVIRIDADGQHSINSISELLAPLIANRADAVCGARRRGSAGYATPPVRRLGQWLLSSVLSVLIGRRVTDPTSGFWAFNAAAIGLLVEHHPSGYPEAELLLFMHRNRLRTMEVPVDMRQRLAGRSTLTLPKAASALARALLAAIVEPVRPLASRGPGPRD